MSTDHTLREVIRSLEAIDLGAYETATAILVDLAEKILDERDGIIHVGVPEATLKFPGGEAEDHPISNPEKSD